MTTILGIYFLYWNLLDVNFFKKSVCTNSWKVQAGTKETTIYIKNLKNKDTVFKWHQEHAETGLKKKKKTGKHYKWKKETESVLKDEWINLLPGMLPGCICDVNHCSFTVCVH